MKKLPDWAIYITVVVVTILMVLPFQEYLSNHFSPSKNYQRGLQDGMENAEYYCDSFDTEYMGSLNYIQKHEEPPMSTGDSNSRDSAD